MPNEMFSPFELSEERNVIRVRRHAQDYNIVFQINGLPYSQF